jgi:hypothetical protein
MRGERGGRREQQRVIVMALTKAVIARCRRRRDIFDHHRLAQRAASLSANSRAAMSAPLPGPATR